MSITTGSLEFSIKVCHIHLIKCCSQINTPSIKSHQLKKNFKQKLHPVGWGLTKNLIRVLWIPCYHSPELRWLMFSRIIVSERCTWLFCRHLCLTATNCQMTSSVLFCLQFFLPPRLNCLEYNGSSTVTVWMIHLYLKGL